MPYSTVSTGDLHQLLADNKALELIDVRTPVEYHEFRIAEAQNVPLDQIDPNAVMQNRKGNADEPLYLICRSGGRSGQACQNFLAAGYENVVNVEGGTLAWDEAGLEVVRGKKTLSFSLERQVRIAAGALVVAGVLLSQFVHPYFVGLSALVGAGLVFAGLTNTCGMGMLLAKMPWNQVSEEEEACCRR